MKEIYDNLASIYDSWITGDLSEEASLNFYVELVNREQGTIVELGIGTGRIAIELAKKGKDIIGIDISERMLDICKDKILQHKVNSKITLIKADICNFSLPEPVDLIYLPFRTIGHLLTYQDQLAMFRCVFNNLKKGGRFIFDHYMFNNDWAIKVQGLELFMSSNRVDFLRKRVISDCYTFDFDNQLLMCKVKSSVVDNTDQILDCDSFTFKFKWLTIEQIKQLIKESGFKKINLLGEFDGSKWSLNSGNQIWIIEKTNE